MTPDTAVDPCVTRFAPSPTGQLHLGHAYAAFVAHDLARAGGGRFLVRIEDIDAGRCRESFVGAILADLAWLGLVWEEPVWRQSTRLPAYQAALARLGEQEVTYPCFCTRREIAMEVARMAAAPQGPEGPRYPGTCRRLAMAERREREAAGLPAATRLDVQAALARLGARRLAFMETGAGPTGEAGAVVPAVDTLDDIVLARKDVGVSYHLAVVVDDAAQGVTLVTRGRDLFGATGIQRLLQELLGLPAPAYHHHRLITDASGRRLAKRDQDQTLATLRAQGRQPAELRQALGLAKSGPGAAP